MDMMHSAQTLSSAPMTSSNQKTRCGRRTLNPTGTRHFFLIPVRWRMPQGASRMLPYDLREGTSLDAGTFYVVGG